MATLAGVFDRLLEAGATIIVIDHDLDLLAAADHLIDMGPGGGPDGGHILAAGTPEDVARAPGSATGPWLAEHLGVPDARQPDVSRTLGGTSRAGSRNHAPFGMNDLSGERPGFLARRPEPRPQSGAAECPAKSHETDDVSSPRRA